ncbi:MAG: polysaccharide pyruvyl transferase family protein [Ruminococcaceae bacterium]|nr:polysaccharide pyruvyl transferase family protein [Oscillospiraceae bacterium]
MDNKYGLVIYKDTTNIGDDIQSYAAACLLPQIDYIIDRENTDTFSSDHGEPVKAIMNGWYMHQKWNWPPSKDIIPTFFAFNYSEESYFYYDKYMKSTFLEGEGQTYLNQWGPIGCRDLDTQRLLEERGIPAFFSGCLTLTLPRNIPEKPGNYICIVDIEQEAEALITKQARSEGMQVKKITHSIPKYEEGTPWSVRESKVKELLALYQNARCVVTCRLHCALPCLAMGVPVLLVRPDMDDKRFQPYVDWMETATPRQIAAGQFPFSFANPPQNAEKHIPFRERMIREIRAFLNCPVQPLPARDEQAIRTWQMQTMKALLEASLAHALTLAQKANAPKPHYKDVVLRQFASGQVGLRYIAKYFLAWLRYKLRRKN